MHIRSELVKWNVSAINPDTGERDVWGVWFIRNNPDDRRDWVRMARKAGFRDVRINRHNATVKPKADQTSTADQADIAREGLKLLDAIIAKRKAQTA